MMCVCDKIDWMENGWMDWIEWMWIEWMWKVESGKWRGSGSHTCKVERFALTALNER